MKRLTLLALHLCIAATASAGNWPGWRGPEGTGVSLEKDLPQTWGTNQNVRWRVALPGPSNSSPIAWRNRVFIAQTIKSQKRRTVLCFDRADGRQLWQAGVIYGENEPSQENNPYCSATPVTDGERVIASFGSAGLYGYDLGGKELWHRDFGRMNHMFGNASSPMLYGNLCIFNFGPDPKARLIAVDKRDGHTVWEVQPPKVDPAEQQPARGGPGGPGRPGGGGSFGPGMFVAPQMLTQADKNGDQKISREEFLALADIWFDKLDSKGTGQVSQEQFTETLSELLPPPPGFGPPGGAAPPGQEPGSGRGPAQFGPARFIGPGLFAAADADKNGSLTRAELKGAFEKWFADWDSDKSGSLDEGKLRAGLDTALPRPNFGGPGGPGGGRGPGGPGGGPGGSPSGAWSTPLVIKASQRDELVMSFPNRLAGYEPETGKQLWLSKGIGDSVYATPLSGDGVVVGMSSGPMGGSAIAVRPGGNGDVTESHRVWRLERVKSSIGSGVIHDGYLYLIGQDGIASCLELTTGNKVWEERLKGPGAKGGSWSSMLLADGKIYVPNQSGDVFVLRAGPKFELLATNSVNEPTNASLAASDGDLFLRTDRSLWCFARPKQ